MKQLKHKKGTLGVYSALLVAVVVVMFLLKQCSSPGVRMPGIYNGMAGHDTLNVAIDYSPMSMYMIEDTLGGFNYDLLRAVAADNNLKLKFHPFTSLERAIAMLDSGICDIVVADLPAIADYDRRVIFTEPTYLDRSILIQRRDTSGNRRLGNVLELAGKTVTIVARAPVKSRLYNLGREIGDTIYVNEDSTYSAEQLVMLVASGDIDLAVVNEGVARRVAQKFDNLDTHTNVSFTQFQSWLMSPSRQALCDTVNTMLKRFKETAGYDNLLERYHVSRPPDVTDDTISNKIKSPQKVK